MSNMMADPTQQIPPESGWIAALIVTLGATIKGLWPYLMRRKALDAAHERERVEHSQEIEIRKLTADEARDHKLVTTLERQVKEMRQEIGALRKEVGELRDERTQDKIVIATQAATITRLEADNARLRGRLRQLGEEASEPDEATPQAGSKPR